MNIQKNKDNTELNRQSDRQLVKRQIDMEVAIKNGFLKSSTHQHISLHSLIIRASVRAILRLQEIRRPFYEQRKPARGLQGV